MTSKEAEKRLDAIKKMSPIIIVTTLTMLVNDLIKDKKSTEK